MKKKILYIAGGLAAAIILAVSVFVLTFDVNSYKSRVEAAASEAAGMQVSIGGKMGLTLFPGLGVSMGGIRVKNGPSDVASVKEVAVLVELIPLLSREVRVKSVVVDSPEVFITRDKKGRYNIETPEKKEKKEGASAPLTVERITIKDGRLVYVDEKDGKKTEAAGVGLAIKGLSFGPGEGMEAVSFDGELSCTEAKAGGVVFSDVRAGVKAVKGGFDGTLSLGGFTADKVRVKDVNTVFKYKDKKASLDDIRLKLFGGEGGGRAVADMSGKLPTYSADLALTGFKVEDALDALGQKKNMRGPLDMRARLTMDGNDAKDIRKTVRGDFSLRGSGLAVEGMDLDEVLDKYEHSQGVGLVDIGSFLVAGPLGALVSKGADFGGAYKGSLGGETRITRFVSDWKVGGGKARATDVAFSTRRNRVAVRGALDLVRERYDAVTVGVLDRDGYAVFTQEVHGDFRRPQVDKVSTLKAVTGSILGLFEKTKNLFTGGKREVFYNGSVKHPG